MSSATSVMCVCVCVFLSFCLIQFLIKACWQFAWWPWMQGVLIYSSVRPWECFYSSTQCALGIIKGINHCDLTPCYNTSLIPQCAPKTHTQTHNWCQHCHLKYSILLVLMYNIIFWRGDIFIFSQFLCNNPSLPRWYFTREVFTFWDIEV